MPANEAWGLDIGQTAIHAVKVRRNGRQAVVEDVRFEPLDTWADDPEYDDKVLDALMEFSERNRPHNPPVVVGLPAFMTLFRDFSTTAAAGKLRDVVELEAKQRIPYPLDEVVWDFHKLREDAVGEAAIALLCSRKDIVAGMLGILDQAKINTEALQVGPLGLANFLLYDRGTKDGMVVLDTGARGTDMLVLNGGVPFWLRRISLSGNDFTKALMAKLGIPHAEAEKMKREAAGQQGQRILKVMEPVMRNLVNEVNRSLGYYRAQYRGLQIKETLLAGNAFQMPGLDALFGEVGGLPAARMGAPKRLEIAPAALAKLGEANWGNFGAAAGLALQGIGLAAAPVNLLPVDRRIARAVRAKVKFGAAAVAAVGVTALVSLVFPGNSAKPFEREVADIKDAAQQADRRRQEYNDAVRQFPELARESQSLVSAVSTRGYDLEAMAAAFDLLHAWNDPDGARAPYIRAVEAVLRQPPANSGPAEVMAQYQTAKARFGQQWVEQAKNLDQQLELRIAWLADRAGRVAMNGVSMDQVNAVGRLDPATNQYRWSAASEPAAAARPSGAGEDGAPENQAPEAAPEGGATVPAVLVRMDGYVVTAGINRQAAVAAAAGRGGAAGRSGFDPLAPAPEAVREYLLQLEQKINADPRVLPGSVRVTRSVSEGEHPIPVPQLNPQPIPGQTVEPADAAKTGAASAAPARPVVAAAPAAGRGARPASQAAAEAAAAAEIDTTGPAVVFAAESEPIALWGVTFLVKPGAVVLPQAPAAAPAAE